MQAFHLGQSMKSTFMETHPTRYDPLRAKHAINDHFHSYAVAKPLTDMAHTIAHKENIDAH